MFGSIARTSAVGLLILGLGAPAEARRTVEAPEEGSIEQAVRESLKLMKAQDGEGWISTWCHPEYCVSDRLPDIRRFALARGMRSAARCLHGDDDAIVVARLRGDPASDDEVTIWIHCEEGRLPVPSTHRKVGNRWMVTSFSW